LFVYIRLPTSNTQPSNKRFIESTLLFCTHLYVLPMRPFPLYSNNDSFILQPEVAPWECGGGGVFYSAIGTLTRGCRRKG